MIVRCPECSTGFKLPEEKISDDSVKLRCSKCSHVFRIRLDADGETEIFYNEADRQRNEELAAEAEQGAESDGDPDSMNADDFDPNKTQIGAPSSTMSSDSEPDASRLDVAQPPASKTNDGIPTASDEADDADDADDGSEKVPKRSKSASSDYNPFPHANLDVKPNSGSPLGDAQSETSDEADADQPEAAEQEQDLDWGHEATRVEESPSQDDDDPFDDAFEEDEAARDDDAFEGAFDEPAEESEPHTGVAVADKPQPAKTQQPDTHAQPSEGAEAAAAAQASAAVAEAAQKPEAQPAQDNAPLKAGSNPAYRPEEMVDPSFGQDGPSFDPEKGVVDTSPAQSGAQQTGAQQTSAPAASAASAPAAQRQQSAPAAATHTEPAAKKAEWSVDPIEEPIAPHTIGGSGLQKTANFLLILLIVGLGFLTTVAALSGWMLDFKRFPHMLEVAFEGAEFEPRSEWSADKAPVVAPAPEEPVQFESVFATPVELGDDQQVILVQGRAKNIGSTAFSDVQIRGILYDADERVMSETTAALGARILQSDLGEVGTVEEAAALLPESAAMLDGKSSQPFTLIFVDAPGKVFEGADALFRVEVADKEPVGGPPAGQ